MKFVRIVLGLMFTAFLAACGGGGGSAGANPNAGALRTSAGDSVIIAPGETRAYTISGGVAPYSVRNSDVAIAQGSVSGTQLTIAAKGIGSTTVEVVDNGGAVASIAVRIGSSTPLSVTAPASLSMALGPAAAQTFDVRGGVAPYVAVSSDARLVGVSLNPTTLKLTVTGIAVGQTSVTIRDGAGEAVSFGVSTTAAQPLSVAVPSELFVAVGSSQTYKILGGVKPYQVSSGNPEVLTATKQFEDDLVIRGVVGGEAVVVVSDIAGSVITFRATVGSSNPLFTTAPATLTLAPSTTSQTFAISGGAAPYTVTSSNSGLASVTFGGTSFSITAGASITTTPVNIIIKDSKGTQIGVSVAVSAAGGGSTALQPAATVEVLTSSNTLQSGGTSVDITAFVKNTLNVTMPNEPVSFSADSGLLQDATPTTDASGKATAKLLVGSDKSNRTIRVTVRSGTASGFVNVTITGTRVVLTGDGAVQQQGTAVYSARVLDSNNTPIANAVVTFNSTLSNTFSPATNSTDSLGVTSSTYTATNSGTARLTASALGATSDPLSVVISNVVLRFVPFSEAGNPLYSTYFGLGPNVSDVTLGSSQRLVLEYRIIGGSTPANQPVSFTTTRGRFQPAGLSSATTTAWSDLPQPQGGKVVVVDLEAIAPGGSSPGAGPVTISANIAGVAEASLAMNFLAQTPASLALQSNPSTVPPNTGGSSLSQSTLQATVRDAAGNLVSGRLVNFNITSDTSGGRLSAATAITDSNGRALVQYIAGASTTGVNQVRVRASVDGLPAVFGDAALTVSGQALFINLSFSNTIGNLNGNESVYAKPFSVYVSDATGNPVGNQLVVLSVVPLSYKTGVLVPPASPGGTWTASVSATCRNTDFNLNGALDATTEPSVLRPGNVVTAPGSVTTDAQGQAAFNLLYGENFAPWVKVKVVARTTVAGTESVREAIYDLEGSNADFTSPGGPAGTTSPFGASAPPAFVAGPPPTGECAPYTGP